MLTVIASAILMNSCNHNKSSKSDIAHQLIIPDSATFGIWNLSNEKNILKFSDLFTDDFNVVKLETSIECLVSNITDLILFNNRLLIFDAKQGSILIFDKEGKYINKIFPKGKGPLEINQITDYAINHKKQSVDIFDFTKQKIISFDVEGNPLSEIEFPYYAREIAIDESGNYIVYSPDIINKFKTIEIPCGLFLVNEKAEFIKKYLAFPLPNAYVQPIKCLSGSGNEITLVSNYLPGVFEIKNGKVSKLYEIQSPTDWLNSYTLSNSFGKKHLFLFSNKDGNTVTAFYDAKTGKTRTVLGLNNDLFLAPIFIPDKYISEQQMVSTMTAQDIIQSFNSIKNSDHSELVKHFGSKALDKYRELSNSILNNSNEDDNPVIFTFNLKNE